MRLKELLCVDRQRRQSGHCLLAICISRQYVLVLLAGSRKEARIWWTLLGVAVPHQGVREKELRFRIRRFQSGCTGEAFNRSFKIAAVVGIDSLLHLRLQSRLRSRRQRNTGGDDR